MREPTPKQMAMRTDPNTLAMEKVCAELLAQGTIYIAGERWSERTGRMRPIYRLTKAGEKLS